MQKRLNGKIATVILWFWIILITLGWYAYHSSSKWSPSKIENITMTYTDNGLTPAVVTLKKGKKYKITINAKTTVYGCMNAISLPWLDDNLQNIRTGKKIIFNITPTKAGSYDFLCGMGVPHGASVIVQ